MLETLNAELEQRVEQRTEELQQSELQFRTLANAIPQLAWMAQADGAVIWYNQRWYEYTGLSETELKAEGWQSLHHPQHVARVVAGLQRSWDAGEPWEDTFPLKGKDGGYRWFLSRAVPIQNADGTIVRWFGTNTDISKQIAAEDEIRSLNTELEQRLAELEAIMQVLPVGVAVAQDPTCKNILANANLREFFGLDPVRSHQAAISFDQELPFELYRDGRPLAPSEHPVQRAATMGGTVGSTELEVHRQDGRLVNLLCSASPLFNASGEIRGAVGAFFDVTERKALEDKLRERAELLDLASEAIIVRSPEGTILYWNSGAEAQYGWKREEVLGKNLHQLLQTEFPVEVSEMQRQLADEGRWQGRLIHTTRAGRKIVVSTRKARKEGANAILEINRDITEQLHAERALMDAEKLAAMGRMAGIIAHEINNPLEAITNAFFLLRNHPSLDEEARQLAEIGEKELTRVSHITRQTLGFYRESLKPVFVSICQVIDDVLDLQLRRLQLANITVEREYRTSARIQGFPSELKQVVLNLIGNAIQAMPEGGRLRLKVCERTNPRTGRSSVCMSVVDTGVGILPEHRNKLFEPFFTTKDEKGTGLGLWISRGIIHKYDGEIRFRTLFRPSGNVTSFQVLLPASRAEGDIDGQSPFERASILTEVARGAA